MFFITLEKSLVTILSNAVFVILLLFTFCDSKDIILGVLTLIYMDFTPFVSFLSYISVWMCSTDLSLSLVILFPILDSIP